MKKIFFLLVVFLSFAQCKQHNEDTSQLFQQYYQKLNSYTHAEYDSLIILYRDVDSISETNPTPLFLFLLKTTEARIYRRKNEYNKSNSAYYIANQYISNFADADTLKAMNYNGIGINFMDMSRYDSAFFYYEKALKIFDNVKNQEKIQLVLSNMAQSYYNKGESEKALEIVNQILQKPYSRGIELNNFHIKANIYGSSGKIDSAMQIDKAMAAKYPDYKTDYTVSSFYNNMGMCYLEKGNTDSALYYCKKSYYIDSIAGMKMDMAANLVLLAEVYLSINQQIKAEEYYNKALNIFSDASNADKKFRIFRMLNERATKEKNWQKSVVFQDSMLSTYSRMNNFKVNQTIEMLKIEYETEKKNQLIEAQKLRLGRQNLIILLSTSILCIVVLLIVFLSYQRKKKNQLYIAQQESKVAEMLINAEQQERSRIACELHDGVSQKLAVAQMQLSTIKTTSKETTKTIDLMLKEIADDIRGISHNLYPTDLEKGLIPALEHLCEQNNFVNKSIEFRLKTDKNIQEQKLNKNLELIVFRIVQELTNNALKYSQAKNVNIELELTNYVIKLTVEDDGIGFSTAHNNDNKGIGLKNISERIKQISGQFNIYSKEHQGTKFLIEIPA